MKPQVDLFLFVFWRKLKTTKRHFEINWPLCLLDIHGNPYCEEFSKCWEAFLRKSSVCTLTDLNPGFGKPWDILWLFFGFGTSILLQKKTFCQKKFEFSSRVQKCHIDRIEKLPKWHFWPEHEIQKLFQPKEFFFIFTVFGFIVKDWRGSKGWI